MTQVGLGPDPLMDLFNRRYVLDEVERHVKRYRRHPRPFSLLMVDIRNMAWVDDNFGRAVANSALGDLADLISANVREVDTWFLCTRDKFIIVLDETDAQAAQTIAQRLAAEAKKAGLELGPDRVTLEMVLAPPPAPTMQ